MIVDGIDYHRTVETNKIVFIGQKNQKGINYIILLILIVLTSLLSYFIFTTQLKNNPTKTDYFVAVFFPVLIMTLVGLVCNTILNRDKLREFKINISKSKAINKILEAAKNLNWKPQLITERYLVFKTKFVLLKDREIVTLIIFPDNRIYFNSINYLNDDLRLAKFEKNFQELKTEYLRIENE